jgi:aminoglycoside phosphotransferase (APT) family kinase protein
MKMTDSRIIQLVPQIRNYTEIPDFCTFLGIRRGMPVDYHFLANGEHNCILDFFHPVNGRHLALRFNFKEQLGRTGQIRYEYNVLKMLFPCRHTPEPLFCDDSRQYFPYDLLVMEFLNGRKLDYGRDLHQAAECLADIHSAKIANPTSLEQSEHPLSDMLTECRKMFAFYCSSAGASAETIRKIESLLALGETMISDESEEIPYRCCINTELNSGNFIVGDSKTYLIDWEKPVLGDPAQDLGHFLTPTTTFWKSDVRLSNEAMDDFIEDYICAVDGRFDTLSIRRRSHIFIPLTCLRGITWCAMASAGYENRDFKARDSYTEQKIKAYLTDEFIENTADYLRHFISP